MRPGTAGHIAKLTARGLNEPLVISHLEAQAKSKADKLARTTADKEAKKAAKLAAKQKKETDKAAARAEAQANADARKLRLAQEKIKKAELQEARRLKKDRRDN